MVGARTLAMGLNRLIDAELDARNPRTAGRELPAGALSRAQVWALCAAALALYLVAAFQLEPIVRWLWPIPVAMFVVYPYLKRVTWLCHLWLGACTGLAPLGRLACGDRARLPGRRGLSSPRRVSGWRGSTSSTRSSISPTTSRRGFARGRRVSASEACSSAPGSSISSRSRSWSRSGSASGATSSTGSAWWRSRGCSSTSIRSCDPGELRAPRCRILHRQRGDQRRLLRLRRPRHADLEGLVLARDGKGADG